MTCAKASRFISSCVMRRKHSGNIMVGGSGTKSCARILWNLEIGSIPIIFLKRSSELLLYTDAISPMTTMPQRSVSIVMPIYNEEALLPELFARVTRVLDNLGQKF